MSESKRGTSKGKLATLSGEQKWERGLFPENGAWFFSLYPNHLFLRWNLIHCLACLFFFQPLYSLHVVFALI